MQKFINLNIDTTNDNSINVEKRVNKGDTLKFTIKVFSNGVLANLTNQTINLILLKADGKPVEDVTTTQSNGVVTFDLSQQATLCEGNVTGTLQITESDTSHLSTNIFTYFVNPSITDSVLAASETEIKSLGDVMAVIKTNTNVINTYITNINQVAGTSESVQALANIQTLIDANLPLLISENNEAVTNIANENTQNDEAIINIANLTSTNTTATVLKSGLESDITSGTILKTGLESDITTGNALKTSLETQNTNAITNLSSLNTKNATATTNLASLGTENTRAETNIVAMQGFGDVTTLTQNVTNLTNEVTTARNGQVSLDARLDAIDSDVLAIEEYILNGVVTTPTISYGMNNKITNTSKVSVSPKFTIQGKSYTNVAGKEGNCEDYSKWTAENSSTLALDSTNKVFGSNGIRITLANTTGGMKNLISKYNLDVTKYYLLSAYIKNGNATNVYLKKDNTGGGNSVSSSLITSTSSFTRVGIIVQPSDLNAGNYIGIFSNGVSANYVSADGIMINEITSTEYTLGVTTLLTNYPYVDSYSCLTNPYIEVKHDNLNRNGNCEEGISWYTPNNTNSTLSVVNGKFQLATNATGGGSQLNKINVKANTDYYLSGNFSGSTTLGILSSDSTTSIRNGVGTFNSGSNTVIYVAMTNASASQTGTADSIMLIEGTIAPVSYLPCRLERTVLETKLTSDDSITSDNGKVNGLRNWKHPGPLFGKDYDWIFFVDQVGYKGITMPNPLNCKTGVTGNIITKYDGKICVESGNQLADNFAMWSDGKTYLYLSDTDTGWTESINPNADETKAFPNGWKAIYNNGTRYCAWVSVVDGSVPSGSVQASISSTTNTTAITVASNGNAYVSGDIVAVITSTGTLRGTATVTGTPTTTNIPLTGSLSVVSGDIVIKADNGSTNISLLTWCKNNIAPGYEGYQLHYRLANPEPITDVNTHVHGDIPKFDVGDNYLYLDSGIVLGEVANPKTDATNYYIDVDTRINPAVNGSELKCKTEIINAIYKNLVPNTQMWSLNANGAYGNQKGYIPVANFDTNATYTVDYKILATQAPQIGTIGCSYNQDLASSISGLNEKVESRQTHDSTLDTLVDLSVYEVINTGSYFRWSGVNWITNGANNTLYIQIEIPYKVNKKTTPRITLNSIAIFASADSIDVSTKFNLSLINATTSSVKLTYFTTDATTITNIKNSGVTMKASIIADCKGRI